MAYEIQQNDALSKTVQFEISAKEINSLVNKRLRKLQKDVKIHGYRKGKVPMSVMKQRYGAGAFQEALEELLSKETDKMISELNHVVYVGQHEVSPKEDGAIVSNLEIETLPDISVDGYLGLEVRAPEVVVTDDEIDTQLAYVQKQTAQLERVDRDTIEKGDVVIASFHPLSKTVDEVSNNQLTRENFTISLDEDDNDRSPLVIALADTLIGANASEPVTAVVPLTAFGIAQYGSDETCTLELTIESVNKLVLPEINDDLAVKSGLRNTLEELKQFISDEIKKNKEDRRRHVLHAAVSERLLERYEIELPTKFLNREIDGRLRQQLHEFGYPNAHQVDLEQLFPNIDEARSSVKEDVAKNIRVTFLANEIFKAESLTVESQDFTDFAIHQARHTGTDPNAFLQFLNENPQQVNAVASMIRVEKALDFLAENAEVTDIEEAVFIKEEEARREEAMAKVEKLAADSDQESEEE